MLKHLLVWGCICLPCVAQDGGKSVVEDFKSRELAPLKQNLIETAEKMPSEFYNTRPAQGTRSFAEEVGHLADVNFMLCRAVGDTTGPATSWEKSADKESLVKALKASFEYCDGVFGPLTDENGRALPVKRKIPFPRFGLTITAAVHASEHYGKMVTLMRLKGIVPPATVREKEEEAKRAKSK